MTIKRICMLVAVLFAATLFTPATALAKRSETIPTEPAKGAVEYMAPMRDGVKLATNVFTPKKGDGPWPVVLMRTPYGKDGREFAIFNTRYNNKGYVYVSQDNRGKFRSEGVYRPFEDDAFDGYDTIEWIAQQPWCNGKVGMSGASAMGIAANVAAATQPPHLVCAYVMVAPSSMFSESSYIGGVFKEADTGGWLKGQGAGDRVQDLRERPEMDDRWKATDLPYILPNIKIPMYNVGGWYDIFSQGNINNYLYLQHKGKEGAKGNQKLLMGPFGHGQLEGNLNYPGAGTLVSAIQDELRWFDYWLKGEKNGIMDEPAVKYYMMAGAQKMAASPVNGFRKSADWPPAGGKEVAYYLQPGKSLGLAAAAPTEIKSVSEYTFDPANPVTTVGGANLTLKLGPMDQRVIKDREDYLRFQTAPLTAPVSIAGHVYADLWVSTDGPDTDFIAKLVDVYPDGYEALVLDAPLRCRYRFGREHDQVKMMTPGKPEKLSIDLWSTAITFEPGHSIALHVTSSNSPRFEVNPNNGDKPGNDKLPARIAKNAVWHDAEHPSALRLPVIPVEAPAIAGGAQ